MKVEKHETREVRHGPILLIRNVINPHPFKVQQEMKIGLFYKYSFIC